MKLKHLVAAASIIGAGFITTALPAQPVQAATYGCRTLDYGTYADAKCEGNNGVAPTTIRVWIICSNDPHRNRLYGPWVEAVFYTYSRRSCGGGGRLLNWGYQLGA